MIKWLLWQELSQEVLRAARILRLWLCRNVQWCFTAHILDEWHYKRIFTFAILSELEEVVDKLVVFGDAVQQSLAVW